MDTAACSSWAGPGSRVDDLRGAADAAAELAGAHRDTPMAPAPSVSRRCPRRSASVAAGWCAGLDRAPGRPGARPRRAARPARRGGRHARGAASARARRGRVARSGARPGRRRPPWHTERTRIGELAGALAVAAGRLCEAGHRRRPARRDGARGGVRGRAGRLVVDAAQAQPDAAAITARGAAHAAPGWSPRCCAPPPTTSTSARPEPGTPSGRRSATCCAPPAAPRARLRTSLDGLAGPPRPDGRQPRAHHRDGPLAGARRATWWTGCSRSGRDARRRGDRARPLARPRSRRDQGVRRRAPAADPQRRRTAHRAAARRDPALPAHPHRARLRPHRRTDLRAHPTSAGAGLLLPLQPVPARDRRAAPGGAGPRDAGVGLGLGARRRRRRLRRQGADLADHDGRHHDRHPSPGVRHVHGRGCCWRPSRPRSGHSGSRSCAREP